MEDLTIALEDYDRHLPFFDGTVELGDFAEGKARFLQVGQTRTLLHGSKRHQRMLRNLEFDVCELSLSSYLIAKNRGLPITAIPVFPRRLFSMSQMWINNKSGIKSPADLVGRRVGLNSFQTTLSVLAKGDLGKEYDVSWRKIKWVTVGEEPLSIPARDKTYFERSHKKTGELLKSGDVDALFVPHPPREILVDTKNTSRLFADSKAEEMKYFRKHGYFPIMHLIALKESAVKINPKLPEILMRAFKEAKEACVERYDDPNWSYLVWSRLFLEEQNRLFGPDLWVDGISKNMKNLEHFIEYSRDQELIDKHLEIGELFHESTIGT